MTPELFAVIIAVDLSSLAVLTGLLLGDADTHPRFLRPFERGFQLSVRLVERALKR